jgi:hypothetical protein
MAMGRAMDDVIIDAALGTAFTGETGSTSTVLPAAQTNCYMEVLDYQLLNYYLQNRFLI